VKRRLIVLFALAALLFALPTVAFGDASRQASNSTTFDDSIGEDAAAPDITSIVVSNNDAGLITLQINVSNRPAFTQDMFFLVYLDTDRNSATGDPNFAGADHAIDLEAGSVNLFQWNGTTYAAAASQTSLTYAYAAVGATIRVSAADLGKTKGFGFLVIAAAGAAIDPSGNPDLTNLHVDSAPDPAHGFFTYQVLTKLVLNVTAYTTSPKPAKAGRTYSASLAATQNDTAGPVQIGTVACNATIAFKRIVAVTHTVANGVASCIWRIPSSAKGKMLRGTVTLTVQGVKVTRSFSSRIG
jgi:hypothetical protein